MLHHLFVQFVPEQKQQNRPEFKMVRKVHQRPMSKHSKCRFTIHPHAIWERLLLFYQHCWWFYVCCLPFIYIIIMEVVLSILCIGISKRIINHRHRQCPEWWFHRNQCQWFNQIIRHRSLIHPYHRHVQNVCHKHLTMWHHLIQAFWAAMDDKIQNNNNINQQQRKS